MQKPQISIVVAVTKKNAAIGNGGKLLFHISDDLKRFKTLTKGHPIIMGRKTFESIGKPLPERTNIVITRNPDYKADGIIVASSLEEAIEKALAFPPLLSKEGLGGGGKNSPRLADSTPPLARGTTTTPPSAPLLRKGWEAEKEIFIIGGGEIYKQALPLADKLYLTIVESGAKGDVFFPNWRKDFTKETFREERFDEKTGLKYTWVDLERRKEV